MLFNKENAIMVLSYDFERFAMSQAATDTDFKHLIDFDDNLLPFRLTETKVENGRPDILFHWHPSLRFSMFMRGQLVITLIMTILTVKLEISF